MTRYESAKQQFAAWGIDTDAAMETLKAVPVSLHCWQGDDETREIAKEIIRCDALDRVYMALHYFDAVKQYETDVLLKR